VRLREKELWRLFVFFFFLQKVNKKSSSHPRSTDILYNKQTIKMTTTTKRTYSNPLVRIGNWREDEALELVGGVFYLVSSRHRALVFIGSVRGIPFSHFFKNPSLSLSLSATASSSSRDDSHDPRSLYLSLYLCLSLSGETGGVRRGEEKWHSTRGRSAQKTREMFARDFVLVLQKHNTLVFKKEG